MNALRRSGSLARGLLPRYVFRHARRAAAGTVLAILLAALLTGTVGELMLLRTRYADLVSSLELDVRFFGGLSYSKAKALEKSGFVRDPVYLKAYEAMSGIYTPITLVFTNRTDSLYAEPVTWLEGWDEESAMSAAGKYCLLPAPFMAEEGLELGDEFRINERDVLSHVMEEGQPVPKNKEEELALRDARRPKYTVIGRIETEDTQWIAVAPASSFPYYAAFLGAELYFDSAAYKLRSYHDAEAFRAYVKELLLTAREPPEFRMDTADADRLYRSYRLTETLLPVSVAAALVLGTLLPVLAVLQSRQEAAVLRALGWPKLTVLGRFALEQGLLCLLGIAAALAVLGAVNCPAVIPSALPGYAAIHLAVCISGVAAASAAILAKSPMALLQAKE